MITLPCAARRAVATALACLAVVPLSGCGGDDAASSASGESLARMAPASSAFYVEAAIRPKGDLKADLDALVQKFAPGQDVGKRIDDALQGSSDKVDYKRDIKPLLGERAGFVVTGLQTGAGEDLDAAGIIETTDADKALATLRKNADGKVEDRAYGGVDYQFDTARTLTTGIVDDTLIVGTEPAFKAIVDASKGDGLDTNAGYAKAVDAVDENALAFVYGDVRRLFDLIGRSARGAAGVKRFEGVREFLDRRGVKSFAAGLAVTDTSVKIRAATDIKENGQGDAPAKTLAALPAGSWAALGLGDLGKSLSDGLDSLKTISGPGFDLQRGLDQLEQQAGIDVQKDLLSWMGQSGIFVRGTSLTDIGGALVVQSKDPAATKAALAKARTIVAGADLPAQDLTGKGIDDGFSVRPSGAPIEVFAALAGERFVLAINRAALEEAINPAKKLEDDDAYKAATDLLGDDLKPTFLLDFPKVAGLIGLAAGDQPGYARVKPYLDKITTIVAGSKREDDLQVQTLAVGVR